jgi:hypothetical protein
MMLSKSKRIFLRLKINVAPQNGTFIVAFVVSFLSARGLRDVICHTTEDNAAKKK